MASPTEKNILLISFTSLLSLPVLAVEPASVPIGQMQLIPTISTSITHNDNIVSTETNEKKSWITTITPNLLLQAETESAAYSLNYGFQKGIYHSSDADNYLDHDLNAVINIIGNSRNRIDLSLGYRAGHDARGAEGSNETSPLEYNLKTAQAIYSYGGKTAKGRIEASALFEDKDYTNYSTTTDAMEYSKAGAGIAFYYRVTAKTSALFEINRNSVDYDTANKDNTNTTGLTGVTWDATAKTTGKIKVGWSKKNFKDDAHDDTSGGTWDALITWNPKTYSTFTFSTGQDFSDGSDATAYIDTKNYGVNWDHFWNDKLKSVVAFNVVDEDYSGSSKNDKTKILTLGLNHDTKRWLNLGVGYIMTDKDSTETGSSYKTNEIKFTLQASL